MLERTYNEAVTEIKSRLDILDVVQNHVLLKKSGANYWGCCPFHKEKTPSFSVNPQKGIFKCFGCGEGGDALSFLMKINGQSFNDVIKDLAEQYGIELPQSKGFSLDTKEKKTGIKEALQKTAEYYVQNLYKDSEAKKALEYLHKRGITDEIIKEYKIGYSKKAYDDLQIHFEGKIKKEVLEDAGLIIKRENNKGFVDRFRHRIMIPILDDTGTIVAFGARAIEEDQNPKYLNSPDTVLYNKSRILYGIDKAKDAMKENDYVVIMEGYFDVISAQAAGLKNAIASCGTSLTQDHIKLISKYCSSRRIFLAFDSDSAGQKATSRNAEVIKEALSSLGNIKQFDESFSSMNNEKYSCEIRVITPPQGKDPDEYIREYGIEAYKEHLQKAPLLLDFQLNQILKEKDEITTPTDKVKLVKKIIPLLEEIDNNIVQNEYIKIVSGVLNIDEGALLREFRKTRSLNQRSIQDNKQIVTKTSNISEKAQKNLLSLYLINESHFDFQTLSEIIKKVQFDNKNLNILKNTIDKIICRMNNVGELIDTLYIEFAEDTKLKEIITDLIYISESFKGLSEKDFKTIIFENIKKIEQCYSTKEKKDLRSKYREVNNDDLEAQQYQMQLREKIKNKLKTGE